MTTVVNLYAGPGAGKSTTAAKLFATMKERECNVELVQEYVKQWAWANKRPVRLDQFYLFGKQAQRESTLFGKVDYIITDAPVLISSYYAEVYGSPEQAALFRQMLLTYREMCRIEGHTLIDIFPERTKAYDPRGRFQTEAEAREIDEQMKRYISECGIETIHHLADEDCAVRIADSILAS